MTIFTSPSFLHSPHAPTATVACMYICMNAKQHHHIQTLIKQRMGGRGPLLARSTFITSFTFYFLLNYVANLFA